MTPEQIAELRAALAVLPMLSMLGGEGWPDTGVDWPLAPQSSAVPLPKGERPTIIAATPEIQRAVWMLRNAAPALLDAAERCAAAIARAERAEKERESLMARIEEVSGVTAAECPLSVEAALAALDKLDRMRPVVEAAVAEYRAADAANDETEPDDTQVQRNGRWAKAETTLHIAVHNYLDGAHAKGGG